MEERSIKINMEIKVSEEKEKALRTARKVARETAERRDKQNVRGEKRNHMLRLIDKAIDWSFIYDLIEEKYCPNNGRPSIDPVMLIKIPFIQYLYGIKSMRQTMKEIEVNVAYRWFLGLDMMDSVPHFSTFGKNYTRRFKDTDLFEQIFSRILEECMKYKLVDTEQIFVDATHVKARANSKKMRKRVAHEQALW